MKHVFVLNPTAGKKDGTRELLAKLETFQDKLDIETHLTEWAGDASRFVREWCENHPEKRVRFYACGGDGTANEVARELIYRENASFSIYPCGSGNDFIKYYGLESKDAFLDLERLTSGHDVVIDAIDVGGNVAINVVDIGFDSAVVKTMHRIKRLPLIGGKFSYVIGVVHSLFHALHTKCTMEMDGETMIGKECLMATFANGNTVGGGFRCAPKSVNNDGLLDVCVVRPLHVGEIAKFIRPYSNGTYMDDPRFSDYFTFKRGHELQIHAEGDFWVVVDGELVNMNDFTVRILPGALRFAIPAGL